VLLPWLRRVGIYWKSKASFQSGKLGMEESCKVGKLCFFRVHRWGERQGRRAARMGQSVRAELNFTLVCAFFEE
jgi:hypothetical protein